MQRFSPCAASWPEISSPSNTPFLNCVLSAIGLSVENRDLQMRLAAIETDYTNLFSYVEGRKAEA